jgi:hypothetical protein
MLDAKRASALDINIVKAFFSEFCKLKADYNVQIENVYIIDETGFQIGQSSSDYVVYNSTKGSPLSTDSESTN